MPLTIELQYFGNIYWYKSLVKYKYVNIFSYERWSKAGFKNRAIVCGANGLISLSVPLLRSGVKNAAAGPAIAWHQQWHLIHWRTISSCYGRAPFFEFYAPDVERLLFKKYSFLYDMNLEILEWSLRVLKAGTVIQHAGESPADTDAVPNSFLNLPADYMLASGLKAYPQVFVDRLGFSNNLSILDLLFNLGPSAIAYLREE